MKERLFLDFGRVSEPFSKTGKKGAAVRRWGSRALPVGLLTAPLIVSSLKILDNLGGIEPQRSRVLTGEALEVEPAWETVEPLFFNSIQVPSGDARVIRNPLETYPLALPQGA